MNIKITELERNLSDGTVTEVHWHATIEDGEHIASAVGTVSLSRDYNSAAFIPFEDLRALSITKVSKGLIVCIFTTVDVIPFSIMISAAFTDS